MDAIPCGVGVIRFLINCDHVMLLVLLLFGVMMIANVMPTGRESGTGFMLFTVVTMMMESCSPPW